MEKGRSPDPLEDHLVRELTLAEAEGVFKVRLEHRGLGVLGDDGQDLLVDGLLVGLALLRRLVLFLLGLEDVSVLLDALLAGIGLDTSEVFVVDAVVNLESNVKELFSFFVKNYYVHFI